MGKRKVIELKGIRKSYAGKSVLKNINLSIEEGEFLTIIGSSGCGKTTLLKMINGLILPDNGHVFVEENDICSSDKIALRRRIGYVIQEIGLFPHMNVRKNILYVPHLIKKQSRAEMNERAQYLIEAVGLNREMLDRYPKELSGGQRQRVGIARALAAEPNILLMDEPFGAVDEITRKLLQKEIYKIYNELNLTVIFVTHDIREALTLGTRVLVMNEGNIVQCGRPSEIRENPKNDFVKNLVCNDV